MTELSDLSARWFGAEPPDVTVAQMAARALVVFVATCVLLRIAKKRFLSNHSAVDVVTAIVLGSVLSRAINGSAPLFRTLAAGGVIVALHWLVTYVATRSHAFGGIVKGHETLLVVDGKVDRKAMNASHISDHDLAEDLRYEAGVDDVALVREARLERNGHLSVLLRPEVIEVDVEPGVQTVRIVRR